MNRWEPARLKRKEEGALDFKKGLHKRMEEQFQARICSIEGLESSELVDMLDFSGVDAFFKRKNDFPERVYGISNRVNWAWFKETPHFSFLFTYWNEREQKLKYRKEYERKLALTERTDKPI